MNKVVARGAGKYFVRMGEVVVFTFQNLPQMGIRDLDVKINGKPVEIPELVGLPGGETAYMLRPRSKGTYQVEITPVYECKGKTVHYTVIVIS